MNVHLVRRNKFHHHCRTIRNDRVCAMVDTRTSNHNLTIHTFSAVHNANTQQHCKQVTAALQTGYSNITNSLQQHYRQLACKQLPKFSPSTKQSRVAPKTEEIRVRASKPRSDLEVVWLAVLCCARMRPHLVAYVASFSL